MAPVLDDDNITFFFGNFGGPDEVCPEESKSIWLKEDNFIRASSEVTVIDKFPPGLYSIELTRELGLVAKKLPSNSDDLFVFKDSLSLKLLKEISLFWSKKDAFKEHGLIHKRGILLEGYAGTGKSSIISLLSLSLQKQGGVIFKVTSPKNFSDYLNFIKYEFREIEKDIPIITIIEDIDKYDMVESELLDFLDGKYNINHHVVIATSNNTEDLPDSLLRPSRFDLRIEVPIPSAEIRREYLVMKKVDPAEIDYLVENTEGLTLADLKELYICIKLLDYSNDEAIQKVSSPREKTNYLSKRSNSTNIGF